MLDACAAPMYEVTVKLRPYFSDIMLELHTSGCTYRYFKKTLGRKVARFNCSGTIMRCDASWSALNRVLQSPY
jgi:hypothetical protein